jgi:hypothetical protein
LSARIWPAVNDQSISRSLRARGDAEQQELAHAGGQILLDLAQQRVGAVLMHAGQAGHRLAGLESLGHEQRLDQLLELDMDLARERTHMLVLPQAAQIKGAHGPGMMP